MDHIDLTHTINLMVAEIIKANRPNELTGPALVEIRNCLRQMYKEGNDNAL